MYVLATVRCIPRNDVVTQIALLSSNVSNGMAASMARAWLADFAWRRIDGGGRRAAYFLRHLSGRRRDMHPQKNNRATAPPHLTTRRHRLRSRHLRACGAAPRALALRACTPRLHRAPRRIAHATFRSRAAYVHRVSSARKKNSWRAAPFARWMTAAAVISAHAARGVSAHHTFPEVSSIINESNGARHPLRRKIWWLSL